MNPASHEARVRRYKQWPGLSVNRDEKGRTTFTKLHPKGSIIAPAAIANMLEFAAQHRSMPEHHAIYIDKIRKTRRHGSWL